MIEPALLAALPPEQRLALAYAPAATRAAWGALFALDSKLAGIVRSSREPLLGQLRLAWWRDQLAAPADTRPAGEPLLALLAGWGGAERGLGALVDGWEALLAEPPLDHAAVNRFVAGRAGGVAALCEVAGVVSAPAEALARLWAAADLAARLTDPDSREAARQVAMDAGRPAGGLPRGLRPLAVLGTLAWRGRHGDGLLAGPGSILAAIRVGLLGR